MDIFIKIFYYLKENDIPNWIILIFTAICWPIILYLWQIRKVRNIRNLDICLNKHEGMIENVPFKGYLIRFINNTGSLVFISNARVLKCTKLFKAHQKAFRGIADNSYELKFRLNGNKRDNLFSERQIIMQTGGIAETVIPVEGELENKILTFKSNWFRKAINIQKYFRIEFIAMVGKKRYFVSLTY